MGTRKLPFGREIYIDRDDFMLDPPKKFFRLAPGREVRLRYAYFIRCESVIQDRSGAVTELRCRYDPATKGGSAPDGRKVKGTVHWVSARHALKAEVRLYDRLFSVSDPEVGAQGGDFLPLLNPHSLEVMDSARVEPAMAQLLESETPDRQQRFQFERCGYFYPDPEDCQRDSLVFNRIVTLRDTWAKISGA